MNIKRLIFITLGIIIVALLAWYAYQEIVKWQALREQATKTLGKAEKAIDTAEGMTGIVTKPIEILGKPVEGLGKMFGQ